MAIVLRIRRRLPGVGWLSACARTAVATVAASVELVVGEPEGCSAVAVELWVTNLKGEGMRLRRFYDPDIYQDLTYEDAASHLFGRHWNCHEGV